MPTPWPTSIHAVRMSDAIAPPISRGGQAGVVHSVFRSALNISHGPGLLTIAPASAGGLPNGIVADLGPDLRSILREGMAVHMDAHMLRVDAAPLAIDIGGAVRWSPRLAPPVGGWHAAAGRWRDRSHRVRADAARVVGRAAATAGRGLGPLVCPAPGNAHLDIAERAGPILARVQRAIRHGDRAGATAASRQLIGLGPGLTPSGDDALVGIEAALRGLAAPTAGFLAGALDDVEDRTTAVSATLLRHAAAGEFAERLHWLLDALIGPDDAAIPTALEQAVSWGATSGTDCLVGVLIGLDAASDSSRSVN